MTIKSPLVAVLELNYLLFFFFIVSHSDVDLRKGHKQPSPISASEQKGPPLNPSTKCIHCRTSLFLLILPSNRGNRTHTVVQHYPWYNLVSFFVSSSTYTNTNWGKYQVVPRAKLNHNTDPLSYTKSMHASFDIESSRNSYKKYCVTATGQMPTSRIK